MIRNREQAARAAEAAKTNVPGTCQLWTRNMFNAPSAGDRDGDGDADAVDGWKSEPESKRHTSRKPPRGTPVAWSGGSKGYGHRAVSLGPVKGVYMIRSTDAGGSGKIATVPLDWFEKNWGMKYLGWSDSITGYPIPKPPKPPKPSEPTAPAKGSKTLTFAHVSLQFSDTPKQHTHDLLKIFARGYEVITGTEAGPGSNNTSAELKRIGAANGYRVQVTSRYDTWVAVKRSIISGGLKRGTDFALSRSYRHKPTPSGRWGDKAVVWMSWNMDNYGTLSAGSVHYVPHSGAGAELKVKLDSVYSRVIQLWGKTHGRGTRLAFIGGDFNLWDKKRDVFKGIADFDTCWDELKKWPSTGHGNIDAIAQYGPDARVKCVGARVLNDKQFFLHGDHFVVEAEYEIKAL